MPTPPLPHLALVGPPRHGVAEYAADVARAVAETSTAQTYPAQPHERADAPGWSHLHVTDRLFGASPEDAADRIEAIATTTRLTVTLHDVPQPSDGTAFQRRADAYGRFVEAASGVVVNSRHEAQLLEAHLGVAPSAVEIIPFGARTALPERRPAAGDRASARRVLVAGFVYPGKGHREVLHAAAEAWAAAGGERPTIVAIGSASPGHDRDVEELHRLADALGVGFRITGQLDDDAYRRAQRGEGVPVAAHQHVSASRSMLDWAELGRRALVSDSRYAREMDRLRPDTSVLFAPHELAGRLEHAWGDPDGTWLHPSTRLSPTMADTARSYLSWWRSVA